MSNNLLLFSLFVNLLFYAIVASGTIYELRKERKKLKKNLRDYKEELKDLVKDKIFK